MEQKIKGIREEIHFLDSKDEGGGISEEERIRRGELQAQQLLNLRNNKSLLAQKAKSKWLRDGDLNTKLFHRVINKRRCRNGISGLGIEGEWVEDPTKIKEAIKDHFRKQYQRRELEEVRMPSELVESRLDGADGENITRPFSDEEIKAVVWECDGSKSPGPDGFNFEFIKS